MKSISLFLFASVLSLVSGAPAAAESLPLADAVAAATGGQPIQPDV